jgi:hypothetical protein
MAGKPKSRFEDGNRVLKIAPVTMRRIDAIRHRLELLRQRQVTYTEVLDDLATVWELTNKDQTDALLRDVKAAARDDLDRVIRP